MLTDDQIADLFERVSQGLSPEVGDMVAEGERLRPPAAQAPPGRRGGGQRPRSRSSPG